MKGPLLFLCTALFLNCATHPTHHKKTLPLALAAGSTLIAYSINQSTSKPPSTQKLEDSSKKKRSLPPKHIARVTQR